MESNNIIILGAAESGVGAAVLARKKGFDVFVSDKNKIKDKYKDVLSHFDIEFEEGKHTEHRIQGPEYGKEYYPFEYGLVNLRRVSRYVASLREYHGPGNISRTAEKFTVYEIPEPS